MSADKIPNAIDGIANALLAHDPMRALEDATYWSKTIGTDRAYLLAMAKKQARDGKEVAQAATAADMGDDLAAIGKLMNKWGWQQVEQQAGTTVVTQPEQVRTNPTSDEEPANG